MKSLKFRPHLIPMILSGDKTVTWRLFDDKNISVKDSLSLINWSNGEEFSKAIAVSVEETNLISLWPDRLQGHEKFNTFQEMLDAYKLYYGEKVNEDTIVKIINFKLA